MVVVGVVAVQMSMGLGDYRESAFEAAVDQSSQAAAAAVPDAADELLFVFPEHLGFLLPLVQFHGAEAEAANTFGDLLLRLGGRDPARLRELFITNAAAVLERYESTFSSVARRHGAYVVGGSITTPVLDRSAHREGVVVAGDTLLNVSPLLGPSGRCLSHTTKIRIPTGEDRFVAPGRLEDLAPTTTRLGPIGVTLCYDGYHERPLEQLDARGAVIVAQPTHFPSPEIRYDGSGTVVPAHEDFGRLLQGRENIRVGVSAALVGEAFPDRRAEGKSHVVANRGRVGARWDDIVLAEAEDPFSAAIVSATVET